MSMIIDASKEDVWKVVSSLGDLSDYGGLDSSSLIPPGEATVGAIHYVSQGKNYAISNVVAVEKNKTIKMSTPNIRNTFLLFLRFNGQPNESSQPASNRPPCDRAQSDRW